MDLPRTQDLALELNDGDNEELIKKNKKLNKPLGSIHVKISLTPLTKEEMNEVGIWDNSTFL